MFVADDLAAWLIGQLADAGRRNLTALVLGSDQERALHQAAIAAIESTARELVPAGGDQGEQLAMVVGEVFREPAPRPTLTRQTTLLETLRAGISANLAVLDDPDLTGTGRSSAELIGVFSEVLAETLATHLVREIMLRASRGGPLAPLADQLNHDETHLILANLAEVMAQARGGSAAATPTKPVRLLRRPTFLAGREEMLTELDTRLTTGDEPWPRTVVLCGLGGVGKTSVAVEYAHQHLAAVGVAWQFAAEDPTVLAAGFTDLAAQLGTRGASDTRDPVASVHGALAAFQSEWLLVFDNARDRAAVEGFLPPAGNGRVLITTQNQHWPNTQALQVPVLGTDAAADFLLRRTGDTDREAAVELAGELGGLPLALEQAAAYIQATGGSLGAYLDLYRARQADLLARGEPTGYGKTVATAWALAFARLEQTTPGAVGLLRLLAFLAPEPVPLPLLLSGRRAAELAPSVTSTVAPLLGDPVAAGDAVAALRRYSLVTPAGDGLVVVHRLVQAITRAEVPVGEADQWEQGVAALVETAVPADTSLPAAWPACAMLLPHARTLLDLTSRGIWRPRPVRRAGAHPRAGAGRRAPAHPGRPQRPRLLDQAGGRWQEFGCGLVSAYLVDLRPGPAGNVSSQRARNSGARLGCSFLSLAPRTDGYAASQIWGVRVVGAT